MKIGILTYHRADNFGAVLQAFALVQYLREEGHEAEIIDYRCKSIEMHYDIYCPRILLSRRNVLVSLKQYICRFENIRDRRQRHLKFEQFRRQYLTMSKPLNRIERPLDYDVIITGSDQVWNFHLNKGSEDVYLLKFPFFSKTLRIAYAASSDCNGLSRISKEALQDALTQFDRISVRESFLRGLLSPLVNMGIEECLDPTFLLKKNTLKKLIRPVRKKKYILVFHMTPVLDFLPFIRNVAESRMAEVIEVFGGFPCHSTRNQLCDWGPLELLSLIANADSVFTTSFHGLSISLIMQKDVWVIDRGDNLRQKNLLLLAGIGNRLLKSPEDYRNESIDYEKVQRNIEPAIEQSRRFLRIRL